MNRSNLRTLPTRPTAEAALASERELAAFFAGLLARGERDARDDDSPDYDLLEAAADGRLDPVEAELLASRLAGDAALERELDELVALRTQLRLAPAARRTARGPAIGRRWLGVAAAAVLLAAVGLELRHHGRDSGTHVAGNAPAAVQPLFADSFEDGNTERWSN